MGMHKSKRESDNGECVHDGAWSQIPSQDATLIQKPEGRNLEDGGMLRRRDERTGDVFPKLPHKSGDTKTILVTSLAFSNTHKRFT